MNYIQDGGDFTPADRRGANLRFGIREARAPQSVRPPGTVTWLKDPHDFDLFFSGMAHGNLPIFFHRQ